MRQQNYISKIRVGILLLFIFPLKSFSQDISGVWVGKLYNDTTHEYIPYQIAINEGKVKTSGFSHTTFIIDKLVNIGVKTLKIKRKNNAILIEDDKFIFNDFTEPPPKGVRMFSFLTLTQKNGTAVLTGVWKTNATKIYRPLTGTVFLEKKIKNPEEASIVKKLVDLGYRDELSFLPPSQNVASTKNEDLIKAQKEREDSIRQQQEREAIAKAQKEHEDSIKKQQQLQAIAKAKEREDSIRQQQERQAIAKAQKEHEDSIKQQQQLQAIAKAKEREDSIRQQQEREAIAKAEKEHEDSIKKQQQLQAIAKAKEREDSIRQQQERQAIARAAQEKLLHAQQAKEDSERQQLAKEQKVKEELALKQQEQDELAKAENARKELARRQKAQEDLEKLQKANPTAASDLSNRKLETIRTVEIAEDSLVFSLYDNGTVDGDTVSVLINGKVIMPRVGLLATAISKTVYLTPEMGDSVSVVMYAENLGSIPPNTGLLVIHDGPKIYEIRFSGDLNKNSKIILVRKKKT